MILCRNGMEKKYNLMDFSIRLIYSANVCAQKGGC